MGGNKITKEVTNHEKENTALKLALATRVAFDAMKETPGDNVLLAVDCQKEWTLHVSRI